MKRVSALCLAFALAAPMARAEGNHGDLGGFLLQLLIWGALGLVALFIPVIYIAVTSGSGKFKWLILLLAIDVAALFAGSAITFASNPDYLATPWPWLAVNLPGFAVAIGYGQARQAGQP